MLLKMIQIGVQSDGAKLNRLSGETSTFTPRKSTVRFKFSTISRGFRRGVLKVLILDFFLIG
jgi:hypothetical protein